MKLNNFLNLKGSKLLISNNTNNISKLYRKYNIETNKVLFDMYFSNISSLAKELYISLLSYEDEPTLDFISNEEATNILDIHIERSNYDFINENSKSLNTSKEIYQTINQIRLGKVLGNKTDKISKLEKLITNYENLIICKGYIDFPLLLKTLNNKLDKIKNINKYLNYKDLYVGVLENEKLTYLEKSFLDKLAKLYNHEIEVIELEKHKPTKESFYKSYGAFNEVANVVDIIKENNIPISDVEILYTTYEYENYIKAILGANNINYRFISKAHGTSTNIIQLAKDILKFAKSDFTYKSLADVIYNPAITLKNVKKDDEEPYYNLIYCFNDCVSNNILLSKERYYSFIDKMNNKEIDKYGNNNKYRYFLAFLKDILNIFENYESTSLLFAKIYDFIYKYTSNTNKERIILFPSLKRQIKLFKLIETSSINESIDKIDEYLDNVTYKESIENDAILANYFTGFNVIERAHVFVVGLSSTSLNKKEVDSPVLADNELINYLDNNYYISLKRNINKEIVNGLDDTLSSSSANIYYSYSYYNCIDLRESSPSTYFLNKVKNNKVNPISYKINDNNIIINSEDFINTLNDSSYVISEINGSINNNETAKHLDVNEDDNVVVVKKESETVTLEDTTKKTRNMSPSALSTLSECPLHYYYHYICKLPDVEYKESVPYKWLEANQYGTFFHRIMELYCFMAFDESINKGRCFNEAIYKKSFDIAYKEAMEDQPASNNKVKEDEAKEIDILARNYLARLHKEMLEDRLNGKDYKVIGCEFKFGPYSDTLNGKPLLVSYKNDEHNLTINFNGSIDRFDGYVDDDGLLHIRVVDYKTGKLSELEKKIKKCSALQHFIYPFVAINYVKEAKDYLSKLFDKEITGTTIESVVYEAVKENKAIECADTAKANISRVNLFDFNLSFPSKLEEILFMSEAKYQNGKEIEISDDVLNYIDSVYDEDMCLYCHYKNNCRYLLNGGKK